MSKLNPSKLKRVAFKMVFLSLLVCVCITLNAASIEYFQGCISYELSYQASKPKNEDDREKLELIMADFHNTYGRTKVMCFRENGDTVVTYPYSNVVDSLWYVSKSNIEYTLLKNGDFLFEEHNQRDPINGELNEPKILRTDNNMAFQSLTLNETVVNVNGWTDTYWASDELLRNPLSYERNMLGYTDLIMSSIKGVVLIFEHSLDGWITKTEHATKIDYSPPSESFFKLPSQKPQPW